MFDPRLIDRRAFLGQLGAAAAVAAIPRGQSAATAEERKSTGLGLVAYSCAFRRRWLQQQKPGLDLFEPLEFLKHCHERGAGGMQLSLGMLDAAAAGKLRDYAAEHALFIEANIAAPKDDGDVARFEAEIRTAAQVGALAARTVIMPGRRYEQFKSLAEFREFEARGKKMLERALPVVEKHHVPLAVENHKDQRIDERVALFEQIRSEFVGACVDTGNSFALLDDPIETVERLAPFAFTVHLKDQGVREYEDGFLLGDIPLGAGCFDLKRMVEILKAAKPGIRFALELITRDPLKVPCFTESYWATMPVVPGRDLAKSMRFVRAHRAENLQDVSSLPLEKQVQLEDANVAASLAYAREQLGL
jgi:sugar phosphate isomerase/epimerase